MSSGIEERRTDHRPSEGAITILQALLIALVIRSFLFQPFNIPSGSMEPTLLVGDYLFVSKFSYGFSRYSLPFSPPLFWGRVLGAWPNRGDIVVFRRGSDDFIKRVIGLPGDRIQLIGGIIFINGTPVERHRIEDFVGRDPCRPAPPDSTPVRVMQWQETLPNGVSYRTLQCSSHAAFPDDTGIYIVPPGHFFMMGDNRENSEDSRFRDVGFVPFENLIGRAQLIFFSIGEGGLGLAGMVLAMVGTVAQVFRTRAVMERQRIDQMQRRCSSRDHESCSLVRSWSWQERTNSRPHRSPSDKRGG